MHFHFFLSKLGPRKVLFQLNKHSENFQSKLQRGHLRVTHLKCLALSTLGTELSTYIKIQTIQPGTVGIKTRALVLLIWHSLLEKEILKDIWEKKKKATKKPTVWIPWSSSRKRDRTFFQENPWYSRKWMNLSRQFKSARHQYASLWPSGQCPDPLLLPSLRTKIKYSFFLFLCWLQFAAWCPGAWSVPQPRMLHCQGPSPAAHGVAGPTQGESPPAAPTATEVLPPGGDSSAYCCDWQNLENWHRGDIRRGMQWAKELETLAWEVALHAQEDPQRTAVHGAVQGRGAVSGMGQQRESAVHWPQPPVSPVTSPKGLGSNMQ